MDADTTAGKGGHERALAEFESLPSGVLLGTQMIAKGLDYPEVTLVGVINADTTLHLPDFRAGERTYQLLEQVAGRAGRGERQGEVIVQTYWPEHPAIRAAAAHDPDIFYAEEKSVRAELGYPPYGRLANVLVWGKDQSAVADARCRHLRIARRVGSRGVAAARPGPGAAVARQGRLAMARARQGASRRRSLVACRRGAQGRTPRRGSRDRRRRRPGRSAVVSGTSSPSRRARLVRATGWYDCCIHHRLRGGSSPSAHTIEGPPPMDVLSHPNAALKQKAAPVDPTAEKDLLELCRTMAKAMYDAPGIGLAAPQIGVLKRVIVYDLEDEGRDRRSVQSGDRRAR